MNNIVSQRIEEADDEHSQRVPVSSFGRTASRRLVASA
jgi:hypothetical protein